MQTLKFQVQGSAKQPYTVTFEGEHFEDGTVNFRAFCTCPAGKNGKSCKHRKSLLHGEFDKIVSGNEDDLVLLRKLIEGSDIQKALDFSNKAQDDPDATSTMKRLATHVLQNAMYQPNTDVPDIDDLKPRTLCEYSGERLEIEYLTQVRVLEKRKLTLKSIKEYTTNAGTYRVRLDGNTSSGNRSFVTNRIFTIKTLKDNILHENPDQILTQIIDKNNGQQPKEWPNEHLRVFEIDLDFENGFVKGWFFGVPEVFKPALDIKMEEIKHKGKAPRKAWTRGLPPVFNFSQGDILYAPQTELTTWGEDLKKLSHVIQIKSATPDAVTGRKIVPGTVTFDLSEISNGTMQKPQRHTLSQLEFTKLLENGPNNISNT